MTSTPARAAAVTISVATVRLPSWLMPISATTRGGCAGPILRPAMTSSGSIVIGRTKVRPYESFEKERLDQIAEFTNRLRGIHADAELRAAFEALGIPGAERAQFVDHPALATQHLAALGNVLRQQQMHVVEQKLAALLVRD